MSQFLLWLLGTIGVERARGKVVNVRSGKMKKKGSATVLYTQIINSQLVYTVHGTHFAEGSAAP